MYHEITIIVDSQLVQKLKLGLLPKIISKIGARQINWEAIKVKALEEWTQSRKYTYDGGVPLVFTEKKTQVEAESLCPIKSASSFCAGAS